MKFSELVNIDELRGLCESYTVNTGAATALLELDGTILIATGWQDICTRFHRVNEDTACRCRESDTILAGELGKGGAYNIYKCRNGLVDVAVPIMIRGQHVANFFTGQFFFEAPDQDYFIRQAEEFGFDLASYLDALQRVPIFSEVTIKAMMQFFTRLAQLIGEMGLARMELEEKNQELIRIITERKQAEEEKLAFEQQLQQTQKLESLGVLAGGIAHDFNNILAIIMGNCSLAGMHYESAGDYIPVIEKAAERAAGLCRQMMAYAGKAPFSRDMVVMWPLVDDVVNMLKATIRQNVVIKTKYSPDIPSIMGDAGQLRQIVMNLIVNAAEAIGEAQGEVCVSLSRTEVKTGISDRDHLGTVIPAGRYLCLEVTDNGCGMDDETKQRIFEPFYTTKFTGRGLGMSAVLGILKAHNGALQLSSQSGQGAIFKVYLPVQENKSTEENPQQKISEKRWQGSGTVLLVEDETEVLSIAKDMLTIIGFNVLVAVNGKEALQQYQQNAEKITLVVTDLGMPVMDGYELFRELKLLAPDLPIIISSGFGDTEVTSRIPREEIAGLVSKPYRFDQLRDVLKVALNY